MVHLIGVVLEEAEGTQSLLTEDGTRIPVEFGFNRTIPAPGTVVTLVGHLDKDTGGVRVRSIQQLDQTLQRLSDHLEEIQEDVPDKESQVQHLGRVQRMLEKTSERQLEILNEAVDYLPEEARPALEKALQNLQEANKAVAQAFNQALELAGEEERVEGDPKGPEGYAIPEEIEPSLEDVAAVLGLSEDLLIERLARALTLAQIAQDEGYTKEALLEGVLARVRERLERLVEEKQLDPEDVDLIIGQMREEADYHLHRAFSDDELAPPGIPFSIEDLAHIVGLEPPELFARFHQGENLLQIAREQGFSRQQLLEAIMELARHRAKSLVDQGAIRPNDVERYLRHFLQEVEEQIEEVSPPRDGPHEEPPITPEDVAAILGINLEELLAYFEGGGTFQELAKRHEMTVEELVGKIVHKARQRLAYLVDEDKLSPMEAREILEKLKKELLQEINDSDKSPIAPPKPTLGELVAIPFDYEALARALGLSPRELQGLLSERYTLEDVAKKQGTSLNDLVDILIRPMRDKLRQMVEADRIDEGQARDMLAKMRERLLRTLEEFQVPRHGETRPDHREYRPDPSDRPYPEIPLTLGDAARILGISVEEMIERMEVAEDIRELLAERGLTIEQFIRALYNVVGGRFENEVARGELSKEKAGHILAELKQRLFQDLAGVHPVAPKPITPEPLSEDTFAGHSDIPFNLEQIAHSMGLSPDELRRLLSQGHSLAEVADKLDISLEELVDPLIATVEAKIIGLVSKGYLSEKLAREALEQAREKLEHELDRSWRALEEEHRAAWDDLEGEHRKAWEALEQRHRLAQNALNQEHQEAWQALDEQYRAALAALEGGSEQARIELEEKYKRARQVLELAQQKAWQALDEEHQRAYQALNEMQKPFRHALEQRHQATWLALDEQHRRDWQALEEEHRRAWEELEQEHSTSTSLFQKPSGLFPELALDKQQFARALGLSLEELGRFVSQGYTVAEIAQKRGISIEALVEAVVAFPRAKIRRLVAEDRLGEEETVRLLREIRGQIVQMIRTFSPPSPSTVPITSTDGVPESTTTEGSSNTGIVAPDGSTTFSAGR